MRKVLIFLCLLISFQMNIYSQWIKCNDFYYIECMAVKDNSIFVGTSSGSYFSTDVGQNWKELNNFSDVQSIEVIDSNILICSFDDGLQKSTDNGISWIKLNSGLIDTSATSLIKFKDNLFLGTIREGIFKSTNNGQSWINKSNGLIDSPSIQTFVSKGNKLFVGSNFSGIYYSTNEGDNWIQINNGLTNTCIHSIVIRDSNMFICNHNGAFKSTNEGNNWFAVNNGLIDTPYYDFIVWSLIIYKSYIFAGTRYRGVYISSNNGDLWHPINKGLTDVYDVSSFAIIEPYIFAGTRNGVFRAKLSDLLEATDIMELQDEQDITLSPNPASTSINIIYNLQHESTAQLILTNSYGQQVYNANLNYIDANDEQKYSMDISCFPSGLYFVTLRSAAVALTKKAVILK